MKEILDEYFWQALGGIVAILSLIVAVVQLLKSKGSDSNNARNSPSGVQQVHTGHGHNVNAGRDVRF